ncbi:hypothetical protein PO250_02120 [Limosilactobacillus mucosae]|uniref:Uncharacterized protein n=1 Tax=Limosilactobacillus mucosae TaxID=97478 RepID=A0AAJ1HR23_LIMMU|nr:hypothetical protein [Limosilactobacillus mucosae]MDC2829133.1 hypothetical protein [Limosilactobacillus mucosae]
MIINKKTGIKLNFESCLLFRFADGQVDMEDWYSGKSAIMTNGNYMGSDGKFRSLKQVVDEMLGNGTFEQIDGHSETTQAFVEEVLQTAQQQGLLTAPVMAYDGHGPFVEYHLGDVTELEELDSGFHGFIVISAETVRRLYDVKQITQTTMESLKKAWTKDLDELSEIANGQCYKLQMLDREDNVISEEPIVAYYDENDVDNLVKMAIALDWISADSKDDWTDENKWWQPVKTKQASNEIIMYSLYDCDAWRTYSSMSVLFETLSRTAMNNKIKELLTKDDTYVDTDMPIDVDHEDLVKLVASQAIDYLHLEKRVLNLTDQTVELC